MSTVISLATYKSQKGIITSRIIKSDTCFNKHLYNLPRTKYKMCNSRKNLPYLEEYRKHLAPISNYIEDIISQL